MATVLICGFESASVNEWHVGSTATISTDNIGSKGNYSHRVPFGDANTRGTTNDAVATTATFNTPFLRFNFYTTADVAGVSDVVSDIITLTNDFANLQFQLRLIGKASHGGIGLRSWNVNSAAQIGTDYTDAGFVANTLYTIEMSMNRTGGTVEVRINGSVIAALSGTGQTFAARPMRYITSSTASVNPTGGTGFIYIDDISMSNSAYPGPGYVIARQIAANGNYNTWTYSTGTLLSGVLNDTPADSTTEVHTTALGNKFSGTCDFTLTGGTGSTGHGTGIVAAGDTVNAYKIGAVGKSASATGDVADQTIFRTGGADTLTTLPAVWSTAAAGAYQEVLLATPPTAAQVRSHEIGINKVNGTNVHTVYAIWGMVDYTPVTPSGAQPEIFRRSFSNIQKIAYIRNLLAKPPIP